MSGWRIKEVRFDDSVFSIFNEIINIKGVWR